MELTQVGNKYKGGNEVGEWGKRARKEENRQKRAKIKTKEKIREEKANENENWENEGGSNNS